MKPAPKKDVMSMNGFSFNGVHCNALGCWYRPAPKGRGNDMEEYEISVIEPEHRDGGYYIGTRVKPKTFE